MRLRAMIDAVARALQITLPFDGPATPTSTPAIASAQDAIAPRIKTSPTEHSLAPLYFVRHRRARRYLLRVEPDGRLRVTIPRGGSKREAEAFARRNVAWVTQQRAREPGSLVSLSAQDRASLRRRAVAELPVRLRELAAEHDVAGLTRVTIRNQKTRWGSCGRDGHICLNWRLVLMPPFVRDYVLIHELMHLRRMDHSPAYWRLVGAACPSYADARAWLRTNGRSLR